MQIPKLGARHVCREGEGQRGKGTSREVIDRYPLSPELRTSGLVEGLITFQPRPRVNSRKLKCSLFGVHLPRPLSHQVCVCVSKWRTRQNKVS